jgi:hypothetical protein
VEGGLGDASLGRDLAEAVAAAPKQPRVLDLARRMGDRSAYLPPSGLGDGAGVCGTLGGEGA